MSDHDQISIAETERLFAALGEDIPDFEPTDWEFAAEEELIWFSAEAPKLRPSLREDLLIQFDRLERNREFGGRLTVAASFIIAAMLVVFGPSKDSTHAETVARIEPPAVERFLPLGSPAIGPTELVEACRATDSWALVDAYSDLRQQHRSKFAGEPDLSR